MMHGKFRWKPILILVACFALLGTGWFFLHKFQMKSIHSRFLAQATRAEEANPPQYDRALRFLRVFLLAKGDDAGALVRYGKLLEEHGSRNRQTRSETLGIYEKVLAQEPRNKDILMRAAKISLSLGRIDDAQKYADALQRVNLLDPTVDLLLGDCAMAKAQAERSNKALQDDLWKKAEKFYRDAISRDPHKLEPYAILAVLLRSREWNRPLEAIKILDDLINANPESVRARLLRASFRQAAGEQEFLVLGTTSFGLLGSPWGLSPRLAAVALIGFETTRGMYGAEYDLLVARELAPNDPGVLLASANLELLWARQKGQPNPKDHLDKARGYLLQGESLDPKNIAFLAQLATVERAAGQQEKALEYLRKAQVKASGEERNRLLWELANMLIDGEIDTTVKEATEMIDQMRKNRKPPAELDFLRARIKFRQGNWKEALEKLNDARSLLAKESALVVQVDMLLGLCYEQLGDTDSQVAAYQRAGKHDQSNAGPHYALAMALADLGQLDEAIAECKFARMPSQRTIASEILYVRLLIIKYRDLPKERREWIVVKDILTDLAKQDDATVKQATFLRAEMAAAQKDLEGAKQILADAKKKWPKAIEFWIALASLEAAPQGLKMLEEADANFKDRPELRLAKLSPRYIPEKSDEAVKYLHPLRKDIERFDHSMQTRLVLNLAAAFERAKDLKEAEQLWRKLVQLDPKQLRVHLVLFEFYVRTENLSGMERASSDIRKIEGEGEPLGLFSAAQIEIFRAGERVKRLGKSVEGLPPNEKALAKEELKKAKGFLESAQEKRRKWARAEVSLAAIAEMEGNSELMIQHLKNAVELGNRQPQVIRSLAMKLMQSGKASEAKPLAKMLVDAGPIQDILLQKQVAEIFAINNQDKDLARKLTKDAVSKDSKNYEDYIWQGHIFAVSDEAKEAEAAFQKAIKLAGGEPSPWVALIQFYQTHPGYREKTAGALKEMSDKVDAGKLPLALAQCHQIMGDFEKAQKDFMDALKAQPDDLNILKSAAAFFIRAGKVKEAGAGLQQMLEPTRKVSEDDRSWARRNLAMVLWFQDEPEKKKQALALIEENLKAQSTNVDDQIVKGILLATKPDRRDEAIKILEKAFSVREPTADQLFALANLHDAAGNWKEGQRLIMRLLGENPTHEKYRRYLSAFVDKLMAHGDVHEAEVWLIKLQNSIEEHLRRDQSEPLANRLALDTYLLTELARRHPRLVDKIKPSGAIVQSFAFKSDKKESLLAAAEFLASCQRLEESLDLCEKVRNDLPAKQVLAVAVTAVTTNVPSPTQIQRVEAWLKWASQQNPKWLEGEIYLAALMERRGEYLGAEAHYRIALGQAEDNIMVLNNLAFLLGLGEDKSKWGDANRFINSALKKFPDAGELLDTRAAIRRVQKDFKGANKDIEDALRQQETPYRLFHKAEILKDEGNTQGSIKTFVEAERLGLRQDMLHPREWASYDAFKKSVE